MHRHHIFAAFTVWASLCIMGLLGPDKVSAHCDGLDGPVVKAAQKALETSIGHPTLRSPVGRINSLKGAAACPAPDFYRIQST